MSDFQKALEQLINQHSLENGSNTPDIILAKYLTGCLKNFDEIVKERDQYCDRLIQGFITGSPPEQIAEPNPVSKVDSTLLQDTNYVTDANEELEVLRALATDSNYPLGETDARKWAIAWRLTRDKNRIDANANQVAHDIDGWMTTWFANCMASAHPSMIIQRSDKELVQQES